MIVTTFTIELDIGLTYLCSLALPLASDRRETKTHRRGPSKRSYGHCRRRTEIPEAECSRHAVLADEPGWGHLLFITPIDLAGAGASLN
jgi:hypothetical protein